MGITYVFGASGKDSTLTVHTVRLEGSYRILDNSSLQIALPLSSQSGPAGNASGVGDITLLWNQTVFHADESTVRVQGGVKLPTGAVNAGNLSQTYQSGLGTTDFLFGGSFSFREITLAAAYQLTTGRSANNVTRLRRGDDVMVRAGYSAAVEQWSASGEVLAIKRIQESNVLQSTQPETFANVPNSNQLQVNLVVRLGYTLDDEYFINAEAAVALLKRDTNLDGLKRAFTVSVGAGYQF